MLYIKASHEICSSSHHSVVMQNAMVMSVVKYFVVVGYRLNRRQWDAFNHLIILYNCEFKIKEFNNDLNFKDC